MDDVERRTPHGDQEIMEQKRKAKIRRDGCCITGIFILVPTCVLVWLAFHQTDAQYKVAIDAVSGGLDPTRGGLSFNLTLGVGSRSYVAKACIQPGTYVEVAYRGVQLAASAAETGRRCAGPRKTAERRVVARVTGVPAGHVLDSLSADMKQGVAVFNVTLHLPAGSYGGAADGQSWVTECGGRQIGAAASWCPFPDQEPEFQ
jgi:hypothetical protein